MVLYSSPVAEAEKMACARVRSGDMGTRGTGASSGTLVERAAARRTRRSSAWGARRKRRRQHADDGVEVSSRHRRGGGQKKVLYLNATRCIGYLLEVRAPDSLRIARRVLHVKPSLGGGFAPRCSVACLTPKNPTHVRRAREQKSRCC